MGDVAIVPPGAVVIIPPEVGISVHPVCSWGLKNTRIGPPPALECRKRRVKWVVLPMWIWGKIFPLPALTCKRRLNLANSSIMCYSSHPHIPVSLLSLCLLVFSLLHPHVGLGLNVSTVYSDSALDTQVPSITEVKQRCT